MTAGFAQSENANGETRVATDDLAPDVLARLTRPHWGDWIKRRAVMLGFKTALQLARKTRLKKEQIVAWFESECPPKRLVRKDRAMELLMWALRIDHTTLWGGWSEHEPEDVDPEESITVDCLRDELQLYAWYLFPDQLHDLLRYAHRLSEQRNARPTHED